MVSKKEKSNIYCGTKAVPRKMKRGTAEECARANQIRYYGVKKISPEVLKLAKKINHEEEVKKLEYIHFQINKLVKHYNEIQKILNDRKSSKPELKKAKEVKKLILQERDNLLNKLKEQSRIVRRIEKGKPVKIKKSKKDCSKLKIPWRRKVCKYNQKKEFKHLTPTEMADLLRNEGLLRNE